jgi:hypothetical protein
MMHVVFAQDQKKLGYCQDKGESSKSIDVGVPHNNKTEMMLIQLN